jgi:hypothetical protein
MALRPRLSPGGLLSRCGPYGRAVYQACQASPCVEPEVSRGTVLVNPNQSASRLQTQPSAKLRHAASPGLEAAITGKEPQRW